ncbi:MAG TPA: hypothetical protein VFM95_00590 [Microcella sp.]|nr:hypothetical protein [Microcella sp.]
MLALVLAPLAIATGFVAAGPAHPAAAAVSWQLENDTFIDENVVTLRGTKDVGSTIEIRRANASGIVCRIDDEAATSWSCPPLQVPNGVNQFVGTETLDDDSTEPLPTLRLRVLGPPTVSSGSSGRIITAGRVTGQGQPGARVQVQTIGANGQVTHACPDVLPDGFWSCALSASNAPTGEYTVRARQNLPSLGPEFSVFSGAVPMTLDREAPPSPTVTSPTPGQVLTEPRALVTGRGEAGSGIQVFVNGEQRCQTGTTSSGDWQCSVAFDGSGDWTIQALQRDVAGNFSAPSPRLIVTVSGGATAVPTPEPGTPTPRPTPGDTDSPAPAPPPSESPTPGDTPSPEPSPPGGGGEAPAVPPEFSDEPVGDPTATTWGTPTTFGASLPTASAVWASGGWGIGLLIGVCYLLLVALPMRLATRAALPRLLPVGFRLTGRNNRAAVHDDEPVLPPWVVGVGVLAGASLVAALAGGVDFEVRYVRLMAAIGLGLVLLNLLAVVVPARLTGAATRAIVTERFLPSMLVAATLAALLSRIGDLRPPIVIGVLVATSIVGAVPRAARAGVAVAQTTGVALLALIAWALHDLLTPATGFWANLAAETTAAIALGGLGSIVLLLLPVGPFPGRALYAVSRVGWAIVTVLTAAIGAAIAVSGEQFPMVPLLGVAAVFAAVSCAAFAWTRWVEPNLR